MKRSRNRKTTEAAAILYKLFVEGKPKMQAMLKEAEQDMDVAEQIHNLRMEAEMSQAELAKLVGTTASAISRLESADYDGHSMAMLRRIAAALNKQVKISFVPIEGNRPL